MRQYTLNDIFDVSISDEGVVSIRTIEEILYGNGSGPPMGIMSAANMQKALEQKVLMRPKNRAERRAERKAKVK